MKHEDAEKLKPGQKVIHRRYGVCIVQELIITEGVPCGELFGVVVRPDNQNGRDLLSKDVGFNIHDLLEDRVRNLSPLAEPGYQPIDHETAWGIAEEDMPESQPKDHFAPEGEGVPE